MTFQVIFFKSHVNQMEMLGILCSKLIRFIFNSLINHTVNSNAQDIEMIPLTGTLSTRILPLVEIIINKLQTNPNYNYASNEQIEIDRLVYEAYGLNEEDIAEVENWYARRYPKLAKAQSRRTATGAE